MRVILTLHTPEAAIGENAKICYNTKPISQGGKDITASLVHKHKHLAALRFAYATVRVEGISIACQNQIVRSKHLDFMVQCVSGDTKIAIKNTSHSIKHISIKGLFDRQENNKTLPLVRNYNFETQEYEFCKIKEVFFNGFAKVFLLTTEDGLQIKATENHKFYTKEGFKCLKDLSVGEYIGRNGDVVHTNKEWLQQAKQESLFLGGGLRYIARKAGVSKHTIRVWLKKFGLQYSSKETHMTYEVWNKNKKGKESHNFGKSQSLEHRLNSSKAKKRQYKNHKHKTKFRQRIANYWSVNLNKELTGIDFTVCNYCGKSCKGQVDHIKPVSLYPELAYDKDNIQSLCKECHHKKTQKERQFIRTTVRFTPIKSIKEIGVTEIYDLAVDSKHANYVANKFLVHNSKRYVDVNKGNFTFVMPEGLTKEQKQLLQEHFDASVALYEHLVANGVKKEDARSILPMNTSTKMNITGNLQAWNDFFKLRLHPHAQTEIRKVANKIYDLLSKAYPQVFTDELREEYSK